MWFNVFKIIYAMPYLDVFPDAVLEKNSRLSSLYY